MHGQNFRLTPVAMPRYSMVDSSHFSSVSSGLIENARIAWLLGLRSRAIRGVLVLGIFLLVAAFLAGAFSLRQPVVVALDVGLSGIRLLSLLLALFWVQETFVRDIERRTIVFPLVLPIPRWVYVLGRFLGVAGLIVLAIAIWGLALYGASISATWGYEASSLPTFGFSYGLVLAGIVGDALVIGAFVLAVASVATSPLLPMATGAMFALASRGIGPVVDYLELSSRTDPALQEGLLPLLQILRWILPDLARLDFRPLTLYGNPADPAIVIGAFAIALGYASILLGIALATYQRREFS